MSEQYIIGIDSGTQSTRVILYNTNGKRIVVGLAQHPKMIKPKPGWSEHGKNDLTDALRDATADMFKNFTGNKTDIIAVGITSQRCIGITLDKNDEMLHNPISWMDNRWLMNYTSLGEIKTEITDPLYKSFWPYYSKVNWLKCNMPDIHEKAAKFFGASSYLGYRLSGGYCESLSNSFGWPYDYVNWKAHEGNAEIELLGMSRDKIPSPVLAGTVIGKVTAKAAADFGIPEGIPVVMGASDKQSELLGAGAIHPGQAYITLGTLSGLDIVSSEYKPSPTFTYTTYLSAIPKLYHCESAVSKGCWLISWFRDNLAGGLKADAEAQGVSIETLLDKEARAIPPGSDGLVVLPDWSPVGSRPNGKGLYLGFDDRHGRAHMFRALLEGLVIQIKTNSDQSCEQLGMKINELYIGGGGSKSEVCSQIIADVFNVPVQRSKESETCSLGAAMCGAAGAGVYADLKEAVTNMSSAYDLFKPNSENHAFYNTLNNNVIQKIYPGLENIFKELSELKPPKKGN